MADIEFRDNSVVVKRAIESAVGAFLQEAAAELVSSAARTSPVDTGQLKGSWKANVNEDAGEATIGSELENAIWNEFGTGEFAANGDGRQTPWSYKDRNGKWHRTTGKKPQRTLENSFNQNKAKIIRRAEEVLNARMGD